MSENHLQVYDKSVNNTILPDIGTIPKTCLTATSVFVLIFMSVSVLSLSRTRRTPKVGKFLSCGLIIFDFVATLLFSIRRFIKDPFFAFQTQSLGLVWCFLSNITVALLSLERFFLFQWPFFYLRNINSLTAKLIVSGIWCSYFSTYCVVIYHRWCRCSNFTDIAKVSVADAKRFVIFTYPLIMLVSVISFSNIFIIICKKKNVRLPGTVVEAYKSTTAVLVCLLNFLMIASLFLIVSLTETELHFRWLATEILMTINGVVDTLVYVLWYRECRLEVVKLLACLFPSLRKTSEEMTRKVFNIVIYERGTHNGAI